MGSSLSVAHNRTAPVAPPVKILDESAENAMSLTQWSLASNVPASR